MLNIGFVDPYILLVFTGSSAGSDRVPFSRGSGGSAFLAELSPQQQGAAFQLFLPPSLSVMSFLNHIDASLPLLRV